MKSDDENLILNCEFLVAVALIASPLPWRHWLGHPQAAGWVQAIGSLLAIGAVIWADKLAAARAELAALQDRLRIVNRVQWIATDAAAEAKAVLDFLDLGTQCDEKLLIGTSRQIGLVTSTIEAIDPAELAADLLRDWMSLKLAWSAFAKSLLQLDFTPWTASVPAAQDRRVLRWEAEAVEDAAQRLCLRRPH